MPLIGLVGGRSRENPSHVKFRTQLDAATRSVVSGPRVDPGALEGLLALVRAKEVSPGDALSCFKGRFREGSPDEQYSALRVLVQLVDTDPHLANQLHAELATKRWRERFIALATSHHPEVRPLLVSTLQSWADRYRGSDIGMHYQSTLRDLSGSFRPAGPGYNPQHTGYSAQTTGAGYPLPPPIPGYPLPSPTGYPAVAPGYPPYGTPYPPQTMQHAASRRVSETVSQKLDQLVSEVEVLRGAIRTFETTLTDYKAQRCNFAALSSAMEKGQRSADRCTTLQTQMESLLGNSDTDESLMSRVFTANDAVVAAVEHWTRLANQELAPDDAPTMTAAGAESSTSAAAAAGPSTSAVSGTHSAQPPPLPSVRPPPPPIDLLLGDEIPSPMPLPPAPPPPLPAPAPAAAAPAAAYPFGPAAGGGGAATPAPGADAGVGAAAAMGNGTAALFASTTTAASAATRAPIVPASDVEGLRTQVLSLASELEKERRMHRTALDAQEAFHRQELSQVKAQAQARIAELEAALGPARQVLVPPPLHPVTSVGASGQVGPLGPLASIGTSTAQTQQQQLQQQPSLPAALSANNPFAGAFPTAPSYISMPPPPAAVAMGGGGGGGTFASLGVPPPPPPAASATTQVPAQPDFFSAFDDLAVLPSKSAGAAPPPPAPPPPPPPSAAAVALAATSSTSSAAAPIAAPPAAFGSGAAGGRPDGAAAAAGSWVNFVH